MQELISMVSNVGFPIVVASYMLLRIDKSIQSLQKVIEQIIIELNK